MLIPMGQRIVFFDFSLQELETARNIGVIHNLFPPEELKKLSARYDFNQPVKPSRTIHQTSESSSSKEEEIQSSSED